jgi:hypothetical protein
MASRLAVKALAGSRFLAKWNGDGKPSSDVFLADLPQ